MFSDLTGSLLSLLRWNEYCGGMITDGSPQKGQPSENDAKVPTREKLLSLDLEPPRYSLTLYIMIIKKCRLLNGSLFLPFSKVPGVFPSRTVSQPS